MILCISVCFQNHHCSSLVFGGIMNFWKPGEDHPDQDEEINQEEDVLPLSNAAPKQSNKKKQMSDNLKNMPVSCLFELLCV